MKGEQIAAAFAARIAAMNQHDAAAASVLFADDCQVETPTGGGVVRGRTAVEQVSASWFNAFPDARFRADDLLLEGDRVAWVVTVSGTGSGTFMGLPPTGRRFELPMVVVARLRDDRIVHERRIYDFAGMLVQLGLLTPKRDAADLSSGAPLPPASTHESAGPAPGHDEVLALIERRHDAWAARDARSMGTLHGVDCVMDSHVMGRVRGPEAIEEVYRRWFTAFPDSAIEPEYTVVDRGGVIEVGVQVGTDTGGLLGMAPTGKPFRVPVAWLLRVVAGRFTYVRPVYDFTALLMQLGLLKMKLA